MRPKDSYFLTYERQDRLLREADADRLARLVPHGARPSVRECVAAVLIALAMHIAPSASSATLVSLRLARHDHTS